MAMKLKKNRNAVALGRRGGKARAALLTADERRKIARLGGLKRAEKLEKERAEEIASKAGEVGGKARAQKLTAAERSEIAKKAALARWGKKDQG